MLKQKWYIAFLIMAIAALLAGCGQPAPATAPVTTPSASPTPASTSPAPKSTPTTTSVPATGRGILEVFATDAPPKDVSAIILKAKDIQVHQADAPEDKWITVVQDPPVFDLVKITGTEMLLGTSEIAAGKYTQVRLDITECTVTAAGTEIKASVPGDKLKLVGVVTIENGVKTSITLDFDAEKSVVLEGKDKAHLKPVIKLIVGEPGKESGPAPKTSPPPDVSPTASAPPTAAENVTWVLESLGEPGKLQAVLPNSEITLLLDSANGKCAGFAGVNRYSSTYEVKKDKLTIASLIATTKMAGPELLMAQEQAYLSTLGAAEDFDIEEGKLKISGGGKVLVFKKK